VPCASSNCADPTLTASANRIARHFASFMVGLLTWEGSQALALLNQNVDGKQEINKLS
jgi:hypothetical protein